MKSLIYTLFLYFFIYTSLCIGSIFSVSAASSPREKLDAYIAGDQKKAAQVMKRILSQDISPDQVDNIGKINMLQVLFTHLKQTYFSQQQQTDDKLTLFTGPNKSYSHKLYKPKDLTPILANTYLTINTDLPLSQNQLRKAVHPSLQSLAKAYYQKFNKPLHINSARRSYHEQQNRFSVSCFEEGICARPGTSEHQNGFAVDIANMHGSSYNRMKTHAHTFGFHQSYQYGKQIDGLQAEPWHRRRIGPTLATILHEQNLSFTQRHLNQEK